MLATGPVLASPAALLVVVTAASAYALGRDRWSAATGRPMVGVAATASLLRRAWSTIAVALASPLDAAADRSLSAHMVQHVLLLSVAGAAAGPRAAAPDAAVGASAAFGAGARTGVTKRLTHAHDRHFVGWVSAALIAEALVMWCWHIPVAYQAAIRNSALHACEHASFLLVASVAWWSVATGRRSRRGAAAIAALIGSVPGIGARPRDGARAAPVVPDLRHARCSRPRSPTRSSPASSCGRSAAWPR